MSHPTGEVHEESEKTNPGTTEQSRDVEAGTAPPTQAIQQPLPQPYHHQQLPYAPYPQAPQALQYAQPVRILPPESKTWTISKLVLTGLSFCWAVIILSLSLSLSVAAGYTMANSIAIYAVPIQIVVILWNLAELTTFWVRSQSASKARRGIHPGAHIGMHLVFWLACVLGLLVSLVSFMESRPDYQYCIGNDNDDDNDNDYYYGDRSFCDYYLDGPIIPSLKALVAMWCLAVITHFVLFVLACIDTAQRNRLKPTGVVYAHPGAVPPYVASTGMHPVPYYAPPHQAYMSGAHAPQGKAPMPQQQNLAGFYAPAPVPAQAPTPVAARQPAAQPEPSVSSGDEITQAPPRT